MHSVIVALVIVFFLAAESAAIVVDDDGFRPRAIGALVSDNLANSPDTDNDRRKLNCARIALALTYPDSSVAALPSDRQHRFRGFHCGESPLYQLHATWRI